MSAGGYTAGLLFAIVVYGSTIGGAWIIVRRRLPGLRGAERILAWATITTAALLAVHLLPAALTILSRESAAAFALAFVGASCLVPSVRRDPGPDTGAAAEEERPAADWILAAVALGGAAIWFAVALVQHADAAPTGFDAANAYFPTAARWLQEGSIWGIADWVPSAFYGSGPGNGSVVVLSAMLPWANDFAAHLGMYPYVALLAVALYALAREGGAPKPPAAILAVMVTAAPVVLIPGLADGLLDPVMYAGLAIGVLFLLRHNRTDARSDLVIAALALGICFGTKFYGYTTVAAVLAVWAGARLLCGVGLGRVVRQVALAGGIILAAGGIWMVRNWVEAGNPLMPVKIELGGRLIFDAPPDPQRPLIGDTLASYLDQPSVWVDTLAHQFRIAVGLPLLVVVGGSLTAVGLLLARRRRWRMPERAAATALVAAGAAALVYLFTPYSAPGFDVPDAAAINVRYGIPAMILAVPALGWLWGWLTGPASAVVGALALIATIDALRVGTVTRPAAVYVSFALAALLVLVGVALRRRPALPRPSRSVALAGVALLAVAAAGIGYAVQRTYNDHRYRALDPAIDRVLARSGEELSVGLAGSWSTAAVSPTYPAFGTRLENRVAYLGPVDDALLSPARSRAEFDAALAEAAPQVLLIGREETSILPGVEDPLPPAALAGWASEQGFEPVLESERFLLMER